MLRLIATYRWELWLLAGIPAIAQATRILTGVLAFGVFRFSDSNASFYVADIGATVSVILLLALSYPRVRGLGREFLALLWGYLIAAEVLAAAVQSVAFLVDFASSGDESSALLSTGERLLVYLAAAPIEIGVLLWFGRQASRLSLPHAFFLVAFASFAAPLGSRGSPDAALALALVLAAGAVIVVFLALAKAWLLGNFDRRDAVFRRNAVAALVAAVLLSGWARSVIALLLSGGDDAALQAYAPFAGLITGGIAFVYQAGAELALLLVYFALVYFVRDRRAAIVPPQGSRTIDAQ